MANETIITPATPGTTPASGHYGDVTDVEGAIGVNDTTEYSQLGSDKTVRDNARIAKVMALVDVEFDAYLAKNGIERPNAGTPYFELLSQAYGWRVAARLYQARGNREVSDGMKGNTSAREWTDISNGLLKAYAYRQRSNNAAAEQKIDEGPAIPPYLP